MKAYIKSFNICLVLKVVKNMLYDYFQFNKTNCYFYILELYSTIGQNNSCKIRAQIKTS